jgi:hypothetical protein
MTTTYTLGRVPTDGKWLIDTDYVPKSEPVGRLRTRSNFDFISKADGSVSYQGESCN